LSPPRPRCKAPRVRRSLVLPLLALGLGSCGGRQAPSDENWSTDTADSPRAGRRVEALGTPTPLDTGPRESALLGVRHDLMLSDAPHSTRCSCLAAEVGPASGKSFFWVGGAPAAEPDALVVAIGARGVACPGGDPDETRRRPSIAGVEQVNDDIIVEVEDLPPSRPLASGAIIPKPGPRGGVYIRPAKRGTVYGHGPAGRGLCKVR
jgi:hypothetical protein